MRNDDASQNTCLTPENEELLPLARPEALGLPFKKRVLDRRIADGSFPPPIYIHGRKYTTRRLLNAYIRKLIEEGSRVHSRHDLMEKVRASKAAGPQCKEAAATNANEAEAGK